MRGFHATEKYEGKGGLDERGSIYPTRGTSSSEAVRIEKGSALDQCLRLLFLILPAGGSDTIGPPKQRCGWVGGSRANYEYKLTLNQL